MDRASLDAETLKKLISYHLLSFQGRDILIENWIRTRKSIYAKDIWGE